MVWGVIKHSREYMFIKSNILFGVLVVYGKGAITSLKYKYEPFYRLSLVLICEDYLL